MPVAEHHDGFQMYQSEISHWNAAEKGPCRDILGEIAKAAENHGLVFGSSSHRIEHWFFMSHGKKIDSDVKEPVRLLIDIIRKYCILTGGYSIALRNLI